MSTVTLKRQALQSRFIEKSYLDAPLYNQPDNSNSSSPVNHTQSSLLSDELANAAQTFLPSSPSLTISVDLTSTSASPLQLRQGSTSSQINLAQNLLNYQATHDPRSSISYLGQISSTSQNLSYHASNPSIDSTNAAHSGFQPISDQDPHQPRRHSRFNNIRSSVQLFELKATSPKSIKQQQLLLQHQQFLLQQQQLQANSQGIPYILVNQPYIGTNNNASSPIYYSAQDPRLSPLNCTIPENQFAPPPRFTRAFSPRATAYEVPIPGNVLPPPIFTEDDYDEYEEYTDEEEASISEEWEDESARANRILTFADEHGNDLCEVRYYEINNSERFLIDDSIPNYSDNSSSFRKKDYCRCCIM